MPVSSPSVPERHVQPSEADSAEWGELAPPPTRSKKIALFLFAVTAGAALWVLSLVWREAAYWVTPGEAVSVGDLRTAAFGEQIENRWVEGEGLVGAGDALWFSRPFSNRTHILAPVLGRHGVEVDLTVPEGVRLNEFVPPARISGRLVKWQHAGIRYRGLNERFGDDAPQWLIIDGCEPRDALAAAWLVAFCVLAALWNGFSFVRLSRPIK